MHNLREQPITRHCARRRAAWVSAAIAGVVLIASACSSTPTVAAYNSQANSTCQTFRPALKSIGSLIALSTTSERRLGSATSSALPQAEQGFAQLQAIAQPDGEGAQLTKAFNSQNAQLQELKSLDAALKGGDAVDIQSSETAFEESEAPLNQQFDVLGLTVCGTGSASS
jgi:hypothetical protein